MAPHHAGIICAHWPFAFKHVMQFSSTDLSHIKHFMHLLVEAMPVYATNTSTVWVLLRVRRARSPGPGWVSQRKNKQTTAVTNLNLNAGPCCTKNMLNAEPGTGQARATGTEGSGKAPPSDSVGVTPVGRLRPTGVAAARVRPLRPPL